MIVEHNLGALMRLVRFVHVMDRGRILTSGEPHEVLADAAVHEAYLGGSL
jgi:branched-chain amino acid transport system ATP-binding protein